MQGLTKGQQSQLVAAQLSASDMARRLMQAEEARTQQQWQQQQAMLPMVYQQLGVQPEYSPYGQLLGFQRTGETPEQRAAREQQSALESQLTTAQALQAAAQGQAGFTPITNAQGQVTGYQRTATPSSYVMDQMLFGGTQGYNRLLEQAGYQVSYDPQGRLDIRERPESERNLFLQQMGQLAGQTGADRAAFDQLMARQLALGQQAQGAAGYDLFNPAGASTQGIEALQRNLRTLEGLQPAELERLGMAWDPATGRYINTATSPEMQARGLQGQFLTRAEQAMQGNLPVDPGLQRQLEQEELQLRNQLQASLGPDYATSTPGMAALTDFAKRRTEVLYNQQQQAMQSGVQNALGLQQSNLATLGQLYGIGQPVQSAAATLGDYSNARGTALAQYANMLNPLMQQQTQGQMGYTGLLADILSNRAQGNLAYQQAQRDLVLGGAGVLQNMAMNQQAYDLNTLGGLYNAGQNVLGTASALSPYASQGTTAATLAQLFGGLGSVYNVGDNATLAAASNLATANTALPWAQAQWQGAVQSDLTNPNNMFWRNFRSSAGSTLGSMVGGMGGAGLKALA